MSLTTSTSVFANTRSHLSLCLGNHELAPGATEVTFAADSICLRVEVAGCNNRALVPCEDGELFWPHTMTEPRRKPAQTGSSFSITLVRRIPVFIGLKSLNS